MAIPTAQALDEITVRHWLTTQPPNVGQILSARAALRTLPLLAAEPDAMLSFFRIAYSIWLATRMRDIVDRPAWAIVRPLSTNTEAGSALTLAAAATLPKSNNNAGSFAARAIGAALRAEPLVGDEILLERFSIENGRDFADRERLADQLVTKPLWQHQIAPDVNDGWIILQNRLLRTNQNWHVWIRWYIEILEGRSSTSEKFDMAFVRIPNDLWEQGAEAVNGHIKELIAEYTPPEPIPAQGAGPHFTLGPELKIALAPPTDLDADGNNLDRINSLLPIVWQAAADLAGNLNPNTQPELSRILADYRAAIAVEPTIIAWGTVFGLGVRLENADAAARRNVVDRLRDPFEDAAQEALDSVLTLHGPLILATSEGRELIEAADRFRLTAEEQAILRAEAQAVALALQNSPEIIEPAANNIVTEAASMIGEGPHPERAAVYSIATIRHAATILIPAATLASLLPIGAAVGGLFGTALGAGVGWAGYESLKKSKMYGEATTALGPVWDELKDATEARVLREMIRLTPFRSVVTATEEPLRRIAEITRSRWMTRYIDFIVKTNGP